MPRAHPSTGCCRALPRPRLALAVPRSQAGHHPGRWVVPVGEPAAKPHARIPRAHAPALAAAACGTANPPCCLRPTTGGVPLHPPQITQAAHYAIFVSQLALAQRIFQVVQLPAVAAATALPFWVRQRGRGCVAAARWSARSSACVLPAGSPGGPVARTTRAPGRLS